jgi:hypothetical protein
MKINNQFGFSMVMVLMSFAIIAGITNVIIELSKNNKKENAVARMSAFTEAERRRVSTLLADNQLCRLPANFGNQNPIRAAATLTELRTKIPQGGPPPFGPGPVFLRTTDTYYNNILRLDSMRTQVRANAVPEKRFELVLEYLNLATEMNHAGRVRTTIVIPMYMRVVAGNVTDCYALTENDQIQDVVTASCSPGAMTTNAIKNSNLITGAAAPNIAHECQHNATFAVPATNESDCPSTPGVLGRTTALARFYKDPLTGALSFPINMSLIAPGGDCRGITASAGTMTCPVGQHIFDINAGILQCAIIGSARDPVTCTPGQLIYKFGGPGTLCLTVNCNASPYHFVSSISGGVLTCYRAASTTCALGEYVYQYTLGGGDLCKPLPAISKTCPPSWFGQSVVRGGAALPGGNFNCGFVNKSKLCAPNSPTTFMNSFTPTGTAAVCTRY